MPLDIISAPAANVALPMGIDEMIHLGYTARRMRGKARDVWKAWSAALSELWAPILASMLIVTAGFSLFLLSSFPPTQRLGVRSASVLQSPIWSCSSSFQQLSP